MKTTILAVLAGAALAAAQDLSSLPQCGVSLPRTPLRRACSINFTSIVSAAAEAIPTCARRLLTRAAANMRQQHDPDRHFPARLRHG